MIAVQTRTWLRVNRGSYSHHITRTGIALACPWRTRLYIPGCLLAYESTLSPPLFPSMHQSFGHWKTSVWPALNPFFPSTRQFFTGVLISLVWSPASTALLSLRFSGWLSDPALIGPQFRWEGSKAMFVMEGEGVRR